MTSICSLSAFTRTFRSGGIRTMVFLLCFLALSACADPGRENGLPDGPILLPTLDLIPIEESQPNLSALLIGQQAGVNIHSFTNTEAAAGFLAPPDEHVLFLSPANLTAGLQVQNIHGSPVLWNEVRYWGYEYSGNETANRDAGKTGRELFDGRFWLSQGERNVTQTQYGYLHTTGPNTTQMNITANKLYYLMVDGGAGVSGNPGLQGRPFVVCTGERSTCESNLGLGSSSATSSVTSSDTSSEAAAVASSVTSSTSPPAPFCGDGQLTGTEVCDPGNPAGGIAAVACTVSTDVCNVLSCTCDASVNVVCGDGLLRGEETCDDGKQCADTEGAMVSCSLTTSVCADPASCGPVSGDGCSAQCTVEDLFVCTGEPSVCVLTSQATCGNGTVETGEQCDDGDTLAGGDCSADCQCDHWAAADTFMNTHCSNATSNLESKECYLAILWQWNLDNFSTPIPDIDCNGTGNSDDVIDLLTPIILNHYPEST